MDRTKSLNWQEATEQALENQHFYTKNTRASVIASIVSIATTTIVKKITYIPFPVCLAQNIVIFYLTKGFLRPPYSKSSISNHINHDELRRERKIIFDDARGISLDLNNKDVGAATRTLPQLFDFVDLSKHTFKDLDLSDSLEKNIFLGNAAKAFNYLSPIFAGMAVTCVYKAFKDFNNQFTMPPLKLVIPSVFRFGVSCLIERRGPIGDTLLNATLFFSAIPIFSILKDFALAQQDLSGEKILSVLKHQIKNAIQSDQELSEDLKKELSNYSRFFTTYHLKGVKNPALGEITAQLKDLKSIKLEDLTISSEDIEKTLKGLPQVETLIIEGSKNLNDEVLINVLPQFTNLKTLKLKNTPNVKGRFWEAVPGTVTELTIPQFSDAGSLGSGNNRETYRKVVIGKVSTEGAKLLQKSLYATQLTIESLSQPEGESKWTGQGDLEKALQSANIVRFSTENK